MRQKRDVFWQVRECAETLSLHWAENDRFNALTVRHGKSNTRLDGNDAKKLDDVNDNFNGEEIAADSPSSAISNSQR